MKITELCVRDVRFPTSRTLARYSYPDGPEWKTAA